MDKERLDHVGVRLPASLTKQLDAKAKEMDCSRSVLIRSILWEFISQSKITKMDNYITGSADAQFRISVVEGQPTEDQAQIIVESSDAEFIHWMCACEYFMNMTAEKSGLGFDEALCKLCEGAHKYDNKILRLHTE